jgi:hypothetical protein
LQISYQYRYHSKQQLIYRYHKHKTPHLELNWGFLFIPELVGHLSLMARILICRSNSPSMVVVYRSFSDMPFYTFHF